MPLFLLRTTSSHPLQRQKPGIYRIGISINCVFRLSWAVATLPPTKAFLKNKTPSITSKKREWQNMFLLMKTLGKQNKPVSNIHSRLDVMVIKRLNSCVWKERCLNECSHKWKRQPRTSADENQEKIQLDACGRNLTIAEMVWLMKKHFICSARSSISKITHINFPFIARQLRANILEQNKLLPLLASKWVLDGTPAAF